MLRSADQSRWYRDGARDFFVPLPGVATREEESKIEDELVNRIVDAELNEGHWTLMHRYRLCADLLNEVGWECEWGAG